MTEINLEPAQTVLHLTKTSDIPEIQPVIWSCRQLIRHRHIHQTAGQKTTERPKIWSDSKISQGNQFELKIRMNLFSVCLILPECCLICSSIRRRWGSGLVMVPLVLPQVQYHGQHFSPVWPNPQERHCAAWWSWCMTTVETALYSCHMTPWDPERPVAL